MKTIDVSNLSNDLGGNHRAAAGGGRERLVVVFHQQVQFFLNLLNFLPQIEQTAYGSLGSLLKNGIGILWDAPHPIAQGFLGEWVFELRSIAGVVYPVKEEMELILEPRAFLDQPLSFQRKLPCLLGFFGFFR